jgi:type IV fimbrial biogenesis protein FimT
MKDLQNRGFTMVELMITVAIAAILMALAVPSFVDLTRRNAIASESNRLNAALQLARAKSRTGAFEGRVVPAGAAGGFSTEGYWVQTRLDSGAAWQDVQREQRPVDPLIKIEATTLANGITATDGVRFNRLGRIVGSTGERYVVCHDDKSTANVPGVVILVSASGRIGSRKLAPTTNCDPSLAALGN